MATPRVTADNLANSHASPCLQLLSTVAARCLRSNLPALKFDSPAVTYHLICNMSAILCLAKQSICIRVDAQLTCPDMQALIRAAELTCKIY